MKHCILAFVKVSSTTDYLRDVFLFFSAPFMLSHPEQTAISITVGSEYISVSYICLMLVSTRSEDEQNKNIFHVILAITYEAPDNFHVVKSPLFKLLGYEKTLQKLPFLNKRKACNMCPRHIFRM